MKILVLHLSLPFKRSVSVAMMTPGVRFMLYATSMFAMMNLCVKLVPNIPAIEIVLFRSVISFILSLSILRIKRVSVWGNNKRILLFRGIAGAIALILYFITLQKIPLASAVTIQFMAPVFTTVIGIFLLKEKVKPLQWLFFLMAMIGVFFVQGFDPRVSLNFMLIGLVASALMGLAYNFVRMLSTTEHPLVIVFYFPLVTIPITGLYSYFIWVMPTGEELVILIAIGLATQFAQYFMTRAYQSEELSKVSSLQYLGIVYALFFGYIFFDETFDWIALNGIVLVLIGVGLNIWYKQNLLKTS
jgi:drug/metabolite transporter (DMT)-like permease